MCPRAQKGILCRLLWGQWKTQTWPNNTVIAFGIMGRGLEKGLFLKRTQGKEHSAGKWRWTRQKPPSKNRLGCSTLLGKKSCTCIVHTRCPVSEFSVISSRAPSRRQQQTAAQLLLVLSSSETRTRCKFKYVLMLHVLSVLLSNSRKRWQSVKTC